MRDSHNAYDPWPDQVIARLEELRASVAAHRQPDLAEQESLEYRNEDRLRDALLDLRREMLDHFGRDRETLLKIQENVQRLKLEVRDLRYAFLLATSRKDRRRGLRWVSRLLSG